MTIRFALSLALVLASACTPGGAGSTDDSAGSTGETGAASTSTGGPTTGEPTTSGSSGTSGGDPGSTGSATSTSTSDPSTSSATTGEPATGSSTGDASTGDASTGGDGLGAAALAAIDALNEAVDGVLWSSESDYPWTVFGLPKAAPVTVDNLRELVGPLIVVDDGEPPLAQQTVALEPWEDRFITLTTPQPWWTDYEFMRAEQYGHLRDVLKQHLVDLELFRIGPEDGQGNLFGAIDMFVIGATADGDLVGIQTVSVET